MKDKSESSPAAELEEQSSMAPGRLAVFATLALAGVVGVVIYGYLAEPGWPSWPGWVGFTRKTVWDYLDVFLVPAAVAAATAWLTWEQNRRQRQAEEAQGKLELEVENQRAQDAALEAYFDHIGFLLLDKDRPLRTTQIGDEVRVLARARTLTVLRRLDGERKSRVLQFLYESDLINMERPVLDLRGADLNAVMLGGAMLGGADLSGANLRNANLTGAFLGAANLYEADLNQADLSEASLVLVNLRKANLRNAKGWTEEQLSAARFFEGATMPDGQILKSQNKPDGPTFEDWLKSKGRREDGENSDTS